MDGDEKHGFQHQKHLFWSSNDSVSNFLTEVCKLWDWISGILVGWLIVGGITTRSEDSAYSTRHVPYQGP